MPPVKKPKIKQAEKAPASARFGFLPCKVPEDFDELYREEIIRLFTGDS